MVRTRRLLLLGAAAAAGAALVARRRQSGQRADPANPLGATSRGERTAQLARITTGVAAGEVAHRARRVFASAERREQLDTAHELRTAEQVADALGSMKGVLMKVGQMASYLDDGLPEPLREALGALQQDAPPMSAALAADVVRRELGGAPEKVFAEWDPVPIAAASIGQVHRAMTQDGRAVAVKVQYPGVEEAIAADLANAPMFFGAVGLAMPGFESGPFVDELRARFSEEADYRLEAKNQRLFAELYAGHPFIHVPAVIEEHCARRVITTELAEGARFSEVINWSQHERDLAGEAIYRFVFRSLNQFQVFNGDPHPGNYLFRPGGQVTFLDFGLVKHFTSTEIAMLQTMITHMVLKPDAAAYRGALEEAGLLRAGAPVGNAELVEYFGEFYDLLFADESRRITHEYSSTLLTRFIDVKGEHRGVTKHANLSPAFVILQRINLGLFALMAQLGCAANWRRIAEELWPMVEGPPSTEMGRQEATWLASRHS